MPVKILVVGSKPHCWHQAAQTRGVLKGTQPAQGELTCWSGDETSLMCPRSSCVCLRIGEVVGDARFWGVQRTPFCRTRAGTLSLLHRWSRGREPFTSVQEKRAAVEFTFSCLHQPFAGSFQTKWGNHQALCLQPRGLGASDSSRSNHTQSKTVFHSPLHACIVPPDPSLFPPAQLPRWQVAAEHGVVGDAAAFREKVIITRLQPLDSARRRSQKCFHSCGRNWI